MQSQGALIWTVVDDTVNCCFGKMQIQRRILIAAACRVYYGQSVNGTETECSVTARTGCIQIKLRRLQSMFHRIIQELHVFGRQHRQAVDR